MGQRRRDVIMHETRKLVVGACCALGGLTGVWTAVWSAPVDEPKGSLGADLVELARLMMQKACALYDAGVPGAGEASNMAKYAAAEAAIKCVDRAIQTHGGNGFALEYGLSDMWWGVRLTRTAPVSREMILNYVAEHSLGLPKSY